MVSDSTCEINGGTVLFLCTGNYYRSRFAEIYFNHMAQLSRLAWRANSCGLAVGRTEIKNVGPISPYVLEAIERLQIPIPQPVRQPRIAAQNDFATASRIIALHEGEHRLLMRQHFPNWVERVTYWNVCDVEEASPDEALVQIEGHVRSLILTLENRQG